MTSFTQLGKVSKTTQQRTPVRTTIVDGFKSFPSGQLLYDGYADPWPGPRPPG
jgi:hypothetical protein